MSGIAKYLCCNTTLMFATNETRQDYTLPLAVKYLKLGIEDAGALFLFFLELVDGQLVNL